MLKRLEVISSSSLREKLWTCPEIEEPTKTQRGPGSLSLPVRITRADIETVFVSSLLEIHSKQAVKKTLRF